VRNMHASRCIVFITEYTRQDRIAKGEPEDVAARYGIWLAKVVAAQRSGANATTKALGEGKALYPDDEKFRTVDEDLQSDQQFEIEIVQRMGEHFYRRVFMRVIEAVRDNAKKYDDIWDEIRGLETTKSKTMSRGVDVR
jgi:hypothetical protein